MRRIYLVTVVVLILGALVFAYSQVRQRSESQTPQVASRMTNEQRLQKTITTQQRINRYFHGSVVPKLKNCWSRVQGRGTIEIEHNYTKDASGKWVVGKLAISSSTLPRGQDAVALRCMQDSVRGTSFPAESDESNAPTYVVNWTWPVPFPAKAAQLTSAMFAARANNGGIGSDGCDGVGTAAKCYACSADARACQTVCVGYKRCAVGIACEEHGNCASGGPFGVGGGVIIY